MLILLLKTSERYAGKPFIKIMYSRLKVRLAFQALAAQVESSELYKNNLSLYKNRKEELENWRERE